MMKPISGSIPTSRTAVMACSFMLHGGAFAESLEDAWTAAFYPQQQACEPSRSRRLSHKRLVMSFAPCLHTEGDPRRPKELVKVEECLPFPPLPGPIKFGSTSRSLSFLASPDPPLHWPHSRTVRPRQTACRRPGSE